jgi:hypothetical protein
MEQIVSHTKVIGCNFRKSSIDEMRVALRRGKVMGDN